MEIAFNSSELRTICEDEGSAKKELEPQVAEKLKHRLADLRAVVSILDLVVGLSSKVDGASSDEKNLDLCNGYSIVFCANHVKNPLMKTGEIDWLRVTRIRILRIESDHD